MDQINSGLIEVAVKRTPLPTESYQCHFLEAEPMMAVGKPEFFLDPAAASISVASLASCPLIVYRRWEPLSVNVFLALLLITFVSMMMPDQHDLGLVRRRTAFVPSSMAKCRGRGLIKNPPVRSGGHQPDRLIAKTWHGQMCIQRVFPFFPKLLL